MGPFYKAKPTVFERSPELAMRAVEKFICALNPITQIKSMGDLATHGAILLGRALMGLGNAALHPCQTVDDIANVSYKSCELLVNTACFVSDLTVGKLYLMPDEYQQRINVLSNAYNAAAKELQKLTAEQVVDIVAQIAADIVYAKESVHVYAYLKEINIIAKAKDKVGTITRNLKKAIKAKLENAPMAVTPEGLVLKMEKLSDKGPGVAKEILKTFSKPIEQIKNRLKNNLDAEKIKNLEKAFGKWSGFDKFAHKEVMPPFEHLLTLDDLKWCHKGKHKLGGFHHDFMGAIEKNKTILFTDKMVHQNGCYTARLIIDGSQTNPKTFFPKHWSRETLASKLGEAYKDFEQKGRKFVLGRDEKYRIQGFTTEGIKIEMIFSKKGKMLTAYPLLK